MYTSSCWQCRPWQAVQNSRMNPPMIAGWLFSFCLWQFLFWSKHILLFVLHPTSDVTVGCSIIRSRRSEFWSVIDKSWGEGGESQRRMCVCVWVCVVFLFKLDLPSWELLCSSVWNNINSIFLCGVIRTTIYRHLLLMFMLGNCSVVLQHYCQVNYGAESGPKRVKLNQKVTFEMETLGFDGAILPGVAFFPFSVFKIVFCFLQFCILYFQFF